MRKLGAKPESGRTLTLLELMQYFDTVVFQQMIEHLQKLHDNLKREDLERIESRLPDRVLDKEMREVLLPKMRQFHAFADKYTLRHSMFNLSGIVSGLALERPNSTGGKLPHYYEHELLRDLDRTLHSLKIDVCIPVLIVLDETEQTYYINENWIPLEVRAHYPDLLDEYRDAGKCYAIGQYTASVFHFMRVMESLVRKFGKGLNTSLDTRANWDAILNHCNGSINRMEQEKSETRERLATYREIVTHLRNVKDAYRNPTMHPETQFKNKWQVDAVMTSVNHFAIALATHEL